MADLYQCRDRAGGEGVAAGPLRPRLRPVDFHVGLLAERAESLGEPYARHLGGKVRELRFSLLGQQTRVTYWLAPFRRVVLLTVFHKTRRSEAAEVQRALTAQMICETRHGIAHGNYAREGR